MAVRLGFQGKTYRNTGTFGGPVWVEVPNIRDNTLTLEGTEADATTRAGGGYKQTMLALIDAGVEFDVLWDPADANFTAFRTAFFARSVVGMGIFDGDVTVSGTQGLKADMNVLSFSRGEPLDGMMTAKVKIKPGPSANAPVWVTIP
jgi:hypothetical protein